MSWPTVPLGELAAITSGFAFKSELFNDSGDGLPLIRIRDVTRGRSDTFYSGDFKKEFLVKDGDALVGMDGEFNLATWKGGNALLNQRVCRVQSSDPRLDQDYLARFLPAALKAIEDVTPFVTVKHLSVNTLREVKVPLPPLVEQRRIAAILDKADALRHTRRLAIAKLDQLLQSVFLEMFGDPVTNPKGWPTLEVSGWGSVATGNTPPRINPENYGHGVEWIKSDNLNTPSDFVTEADERLSDVGLLLARTVPAGSILVTCIAGSLSCIGNLAITDRRVAFNQQINSVTPSQAPTEFLYFLLKMAKSSVQDASTHGMKGMVSKSKFSAIRLPNPPIELQKLFAARFNKLLLVKRDAGFASDKQQKIFLGLQQEAFGQLL